MVLDDMTWESSRVAEKEVAPNFELLISDLGRDGLINKHWKEGCLIVKHFSVDFPMLTFIFGGYSTEPGEQYHPLEEGGHAGLFFFLLN